MKAVDVQPGAMYALRPVGDGPLRAVKAAQARQDYLIYEGPGGHRWVGDLSKVMGRWEIHDRARADAQQVVDRLTATTPATADHIRLVEQGFADFRILITCTTEQALHLIDRTDNQGRGGPVDA